MKLVSELDLPTFDYTAPDLSAGRPVSSKASPSHLHEPDLI
jgi:hypothetical protein